MCGLLKVARESAMGRITFCRGIRLWMTCFVVMSCLMTAPAFGAMAGDFNGNDSIDLGDVILCQQVVAGFPLTGTSLQIQSDVNSDGRIGVEDALYCLQVLAKIRNHPDIDDDNDGFTEHQGDCNDADHTIHPGAVETCGDGIDQNCDTIDQNCIPDITYAHENFSTGPGGFFDLWGYSASNGRFVFRGNETDYTQLNYWNGGLNPSGNWYPQPGHSNYFSEFYVSVDTSWDGGEINYFYGLAVCIKRNSSGNADWIRFSVTKSGFYAVGKIENNAYKAVVGWKHSLLFNISGQLNQLAIQKVGNNYRFFINGYEVEQVTIEGFNGGAIGFESAQKVDVSYDDFTVTNPYQGQIVIPSAGYLRQRNELIYKSMTIPYLWYDKVPAIPYSDYQSAEALVEDLRYGALDRWSYIVSKEEYYKQMEEGKFIGIGIGIARGGQTDCRIQFVYPSSPAALQGLQRGDSILKVNGKTTQEIETQGLWDSVFGPNQIGLAVELEIQRGSEAPFKLLLGKAWVTIKSVLHYEVIPLNGSKIGYFVFNQFINTATADIDTAFAEFKNNSVSGLVIDLRYNPGGSLNLVKYLGERIAGSNVAGRTCLRLVHNDRYSDRNSEYTFTPPSQALNLNRLLVITTAASCSASEALINSLQPFVEVIRIGETTCGKPVGMHGYDIFDLHISPIEFRAENANGEGDYFDGLTPTCSASDDLNRALGDREESSLEEALYYIDTNSCSVSGAGVSALGKEQPSTRKPRLRGFRREVGAF